MEQQPIGHVTHYYTNLCVAGVLLNDALQAGDIVRILGKHTDFVQRATSIQLNHQAVQSAKAGEEIGLLVDYRARVGDRVYRLIGPEAEKLVAPADEDLHQRELDR